MGNFRVQSSGMDSRPRSNRMNKLPFLALAIATTLQAGVGQDLSDTIKHLSEAGYTNNSWQTYHGYPLILSKNSGGVTVMTMFNKTVTHVIHVLCLTPKPATPEIVKALQVSYGKK